MRISRVSWLLIAVGGVIFGAAIIAIAHVLPSNQRHAMIMYVDAKPAAILTPASGIVAAPPLAAIEAAPDPGRMLDHHPLDSSLRDRNGNEPKRDVTETELHQLATDYDVIADDLRQQPDGTALGSNQMAILHQINPGIRVLRVIESLTTSDPSFAGIRPDDGSHSSWFLRDAAGEPVLAYGGNAAWDGEPNFAMDPASLDVRNAIAIRARQFGKLGYDGVVLHGVAATLPPSLTAQPVNAATGRPYTDAEWRDAVAGLLAAIHAIVPDAAIFIDAAPDAPIDLGSIDGLMRLDPE